MITSHVVCILRIGHVIVLQGENLVGYYIKL